MWISYKNIMYLSLVRSRRGLAAKPTNFIQVFRHCSAISLGAPPPAVMQLFTKNQSGKSYKVSRSERQHIQDRNTFYYFLLMYLQKFGFSWTVHVAALARIGMNGKWLLLVKYCNSYFHCMSVQSGDERFKEHKNNNRVLF